MTPEKKQEINRVIAEAMGLKLVPRIYGSMVVIEEGTTQADYYNSISDVLDAVDAICPRSDGFAWCLSWSVKRQRFEFDISDHRDGFPPKRYHGHNKESRPAAVSLALVQYIKEE